jgi:protein involved in polysaccharide export with SLBB domain
MPNDHVAFPTRLSARQLSTGRRVLKARLRRLTERDGITVTVVPAPVTVVIITGATSS